MKNMNATVNIQNNSQYQPDQQKDTLYAITSLLIEQGLITQEQICEAQQKQASLSDTQQKPLIPILKELNHISNEQFEMTLKSNKVVSKIGELLVELGHLDKGDLEKALKIQSTSKKTKKLGNILLSEKFVDEKRINQVLKYQKKDVDIRNVKLFPFKRTYVTLGTLVAIIISMVGIVYSYFEQQSIYDKKASELEQKIESFNKEISDRKYEIQTQKSEISKLKADLAQTYPDNFPIPLRPNASRTIISPKLAWSDSSTRVELDWYVPDKVEPGKYYISMKNINTSNISKHDITLRNNPITIKIDDAYEDYVWYIGKTGSTKKSRSMKITVYPSALERVIQTGRLLVGTTVPAESTGHPLTKDKDEGKMVKALTKFLRSRLEMESMELEIKPFKWDDLLNEVRLGNVDIAIAGFTFTPEREERYHPLKFSVPYNYNHQMFVMNRGKRIEEPFPVMLNGANVAIQKDSTNLRAAREVLSSKYHFDFVETDSFQKAYTALRENKIQFALIDSVYYDINKNEYDIKPYGPYLDEVLKEHNIKYLGSEKEKYAIAVHHAVPEGYDKASLLAYINEFLASYAK